ncbi:MAG: DUF5123 domain-containing protein [Candidatus Omnitrophica bacterium]|nr:DUF5123 domain-containing protein [Candidatus Omnitrophota bacterium]
MKFKCKFSQVLVRYLSLAFFILIINVGQSFALPPVIFYSDLTSGPNTGGQDNKGVFVTICGKNFGSARGTSYVTIGGGYADNYPIWTDTKVTFQLGVNAATGDIILRTSEGTSNGILFTVRSGNIYFADNINGNDSTGDGSIDNPWESLNPKLVNEASAGDTFYLRQGVWTEKLYVGANSGTSGNEIAIVGYPGETAAIIKSSGRCIEFGTARNYYIFSNITITTPDAAIHIIGTGNRFINLDVVGLTDGGIDYAIIHVLGGAGTKIYGCSLHGARSNQKLDHPLYIGYGSDDTDFGWNHIYDNNVDVGPLISTNQDGAGNNSAYQFVGTKIHDNIINGYPPSGATVRARGIGFIAQYAGSTAQVYNNIFMNCGPSGASTCYQISGSVDYYNNTFYNCTGANALSVGSDPASNNYSETVNIKNNIFYVNSSTSYISNSYGMVTVDYNNYYGNRNGPEADTHAVNGDPKFTDAANGNFSLQASSPCIDAGYDTSSVVAKDADGITRPQNSVVDIGAFEYVSSIPDTTAPAAVSNLSVTGTTSSSASLRWTSPGDDGSSGTAASYDIRYSTATINGSNWVSATQASNEPLPQVAGSIQTMTVSGLTASTTYYFAMKVSDEAPNTSALSNVASAATATPTPADTTPPYTTGHSPAKLAVDVTPGTNIVLHVKDDGAGVDINTIVMKVNGQVVTPVITGTPADYTLTYDPSSDFSAGQVVNVTVDARDLAP